MAKKPWRTVQVGEDAGRFTRQQIIDAVEAVKARKEAKSNGRRSTTGGRSSSSTAHKTRA